MGEVEEGEARETIRTEFATGRVKRIMKLDKDINKVNSDALFLVTSSAEFFIRFLAEKSAGVAGEKKRKTVKLDDIVVAVKRHRPSSDFLLDSLPTTTTSAAEQTRTKKKPAGAENHAATRRIDSFFSREKSV
ncbi:hypothetical protein ACFE04_024146 [Oxalis oulophora]